MRLLGIGRFESKRLGLLVGLVAVGCTTVLVYPLKSVTPVLSTGVVYLLCVLLVSIYWGFLVGVTTAFASAAAFNWFHIPPTGRFTIAEGENWVALIVFLITAGVVSSVAQAARQRAQEAEIRRSEADLAAEMARILLGGGSITESISLVGQRLSAALGVASAEITIGGGVAKKPRQVAVELTVGDSGGALLLPEGVDNETLQRVRTRIAPALQALLNAAIHRERLQAEVVETQALRRSDGVKTALLQAVSHDLRSPLTAIVASADAARSTSLDIETRQELITVIADEASRLTELINKLLELSRLEAGAAHPRRDWCSIDELIRSAIGEIAGEDDFSTTVEDELPFVLADAVQLERALVNLFENSRRFAGEQPVYVNAHRAQNKVVLRVIDHGPGIDAGSIQHIFEPFYRVSDKSGHSGSGLGLAIARGFIEANGGTVTVESLPGQSTTFVIELPLPQDGVGDSAK